MNAAAELFLFLTFFTFMLPLDALPPTACCATLEHHAGGWVMQRWRGLAVVACVVLGMSGAARADWLADAAAAHTRGDYRAEINILKPRADQGNAAAQYRLGLMYHNGQGVAQEYKAAVKCYTQAAEQGHAGAQFVLGTLNLIGQGVSQDYKAAAKWYTLAAEQGHAVAQNNLGHLYDSGEGVSQDYKKAAKWYTLAAEQGDATAQASLGALYHNGYGVVQDYVKAHMWFNISAIERTLPDAAKYRDLVAKQMTAAQIAKAQELATKCVAQRFRNCGS
jgi:TPR repeat protein